MGDTTPHGRASWASPSPRMEGTWLRAGTMQPTWVHLFLSALGYRYDRTSCLHFSPCMLSAMECDLELSD